MKYATLTLQELKNLCKDRSAEVVGHKGHKQTYIDSLQRQDALSVHDLPDETVEHEITEENLSKDFPTYVVKKQDVVCSTCATCPAWEWKGFSDGGGVCKAREITRNGNATYHASVCDGAMERWQQTKPAENLEEVKQELEEIYNHVSLVGYFEEPAKVETTKVVKKYQPRILPEWEYYGSRVMVRRPPNKAEDAPWERVPNDYIFAVYIGCDTEAEGRLLIETLIKCKGFGRTRTGKDFTKSLLLRRSKWSMNTDWEVRILNPRFKAFDKKSIIIRGELFSLSNFENSWSFQYHLDSHHKRFPNSIVAWEKTDKGLVPSEFHLLGLISPDNDFRSELYKDSYQFTLVGKNNQITYKTKIDNEGYCYFYTMIDGLMVNIATSKDNDLFYYGYDSMNDYARTALSALRWWFNDKKAAVNTTFCKELIKGVQS